VVCTKNIIDEFGQSAGKVWKAINTHGPLTEKEIIKNTRLTKKNLYAAIGWLARENKINLDNNLYNLGETNLTNEIGLGAGKVLNTIEVCGEIDVASITRLIEVKEIDVYHALGWLAREDKIQAKKGRLKQSPVKFILK